MRVLSLLVLVGCAPKIDKGVVPAERWKAPVAVLEQPVESPNIYLQAVIAAGSSRDPVGKEGLAALTARSMLEAGAGERDSATLRDALFPTGNAPEVVVDRDFVSIRLRCHVDHQALCAEVFADILTQPRFEPADVARLRDDALYAVSEGLLADEEALGDAALQAWLFESHPYGHPVDGRAGVLPLLDAQAAAAFYARHYVREATLVGIAGTWTPETLATLRTRLEAIPIAASPDNALMQPVPIEGRALRALDTGTPVTGFHFGHPLEVTRDHPDFPALYLAASALGEHRQSSGRLYQAIRHNRGLNYGDYAYAEPFVQRGWAPVPELGIVRRQPYFSVWIRPVSVDNAPFALRLALAEVERWVSEGLTDDELDDSRRYLKGHLPLLAQDPGRRLSYALDAQASGTPNLLETLPAALDALDADTVKAALQRHIHPDRIKILAVSGEAEALKKTLLSGDPTPITYQDVTPDEAQAARDTEIAAWPLSLDAATVIGAEGVFR